MMTAEFGACWVISPAAVMPSMSGMLMSIRTMSGWSWSTFWTASRPSPAVPTTSMSCSNRSSLLMLSRLSGTSSTTRMRIFLLMRLPLPRAGVRCQVLRCQVLGAGCQVSGVGISAERMGPDARPAP